MHHLSDLSASQRGWRIGGVGARALVARFCSLDTHPGVFGPARCARTLFAPLPVALLPFEAGFQLIADASVAPYLRDCFASIPPDPADPVSFCSNRGTYTSPPR